MKYILPFCLFTLVACSEKSDINAKICRSDASEKTVQINAGKFQMGNDAIPEEAPRMTMHIDSFKISATEITNAQFAKFVAATGYQTKAERGLADGELPHITGVWRQPGGMIFAVSQESAANDLWWHYILGANWRQPLGPKSNIDALQDHPVVQIAQEDAMAYAKWVGGRLPTEAEWEYAAARAEYDPNTEERNANTWQGLFPYQNSLEDGYLSTAPVGCFAPNENGLYDMIGNVWEITQTPYFTSHSATTDDPNGFNPAEPNLPVTVIKGGSYLCAENFCMRYRATARHSQDKSLGSSHIGFRVVWDDVPHTE